MKEDKLCIILFEILLALIGLTMGGLPGPDNSSKSSRRLAPCQICKALVTSFDTGIQRTANGHFGGGDTAWEEENKKSYKNSELRLTEIQEGLCADVSVGKDQCHELASNNEDLLEEWWASHRNTGDDLMTWLCIQKLEVCCPDNHYGPNCLPCPGYPDNLCSKHGKCKGNGTRKGSGECSCETGYAGEMCDSCASLYYEAYKEDNLIVCSACHKACKNACSGAGAKNCELCKEGWELDEEHGCVDSNECLLETRPCKKSEFCQNIEGSYSCLSCDTACASCFGSGPEMCEHCAPEYTMKDKKCTDSSSVGRERQMNVTRYFTYFGLFLMSVVVFQKNAKIASLVGIGVGVYITATEYLLSSTNG